MYSFREGSSWRVPCHARVLPHLWMIMGLSPCRCATPRATSMPMASASASLKGLLWGLDMLAMSSLARLPPCADYMRHVCGVDVAHRCACGCVLGVQAAGAWAAVARRGVQQQYVKRVRA